jgi:hypothetical protein
LILTRSYAAPPSSSVELIDHDSETQKLSESMAAAALGDYDIVEENREVDVPQDDNSN